MSTFNIHEAKTHFSKLIERVELGEEIFIGRAGKTVAKLVPVAASLNVPRRALSADKITPGKINLDSANLPDAQRAGGVYGVLDWVGMSDIAMPVRLTQGSASARVDIAVDLIDPNARGIHMSRLYLLLDEALSSQMLSPALLKSILVEALHSHNGLSHRAKISLRFDLLLRRTALASGNSGWRAYPVKITACADHLGAFELRVCVQLLYSSTCPSSAALARQVLQQRFGEDFQPDAIARSEAMNWLMQVEGGSVATAHAQRSTMDLEIQLQKPAELSTWPFEALIDAIELALQTPVQTAVKRIDEQAFARRNGANLMFVEDALRRARNALESLEFVGAYHAQAKHLESLHAHDASGIIERQEA
jgi:GTP cyclohydrolase IB